MLHVRVLGSGAGGGLPQWNCHCKNCTDVRAGKEGISARTQSSIAVSCDQKNWILINASPDILQQLWCFDECNQIDTPRGSGIKSVVVTDSQLDHTTGLFMLREGCPLSVYCTNSVKEDLTEHYPIFRILSHWNGGLQHQSIDIDHAFELHGVQFCPMRLRSEAPPYSPFRGNPKDDHSIGLHITTPNMERGLFYAPAIGEELDNYLIKYIEKSSCILIDGTFWQEDEMPQSGVGDKLAQSMGHLPLSGAGGIIEQLQPFKQQRKILIHINNTNPVLQENSPERTLLNDQGIEVAYDGMNIEID